MLTWLTEEIGARPLGLTRVMVGAAAAVRALVAIPILVRLSDPDIIDAPHFDWFPDPSIPLVVGLVVVWVAAAIGFMLGWKVPLTGTVLAAAIAFTLTLDQQLYANHLYLMFWLTALLTLASAGSGLNVRRTDRPVVRWPVFLLMTQLSVVYGFSGLTKLNEDFLSGRVLAGVLRGGAIPFPESLRTPAVLTVVATTAVIVELFVAFFIWRPRFRPAAFVLGLGLHASITLLMAETWELAVFSVEMLSLYPLFLSLGPLALRARRDCQACVTLERRVRRFDVLRTIDVDLTSEGEAHVELDHLEEHQVGFVAVSRTAEHLVPHLWAAPLLRLPPVRILGSRRHTRRHPIGAASPEGRDQ